MKKKILGGLAVLIIAVAAMWNVNIGSKPNAMMSDVMLANVEALAQIESGGDGSIMICCNTGYPNYICKICCNCGAAYEGDKNGKPIGLKGKCKNPDCGNNFDECD